MDFSSEVKLGKLAGFDIYIQPIGLLILAVFSISRGTLLSGLIFFAALITAVTCHELGHAYVARRRGMWVQRIVLNAFGGVTYWQGRGGAGSWKDRLWITAAGPAVNLALALVFFLLFTVLASVLPASLLEPLFWICVLNLALGLFNLLPVYPLDGGMLLHTSMTGRFGARRASLAYLVGIGGAVLMAVYGVFAHQPFLAIFGLLFAYQNWQKWQQEAPPGGFATLRADWETQREREWLRRHRAEVDAALRQSLEQGIQSLTPHQKDILRKARRYDEWRN